MAEQESAEQESAEQDGEPRMFSNVQEIRNLVSEITESADENGNGEITGQQVAELLEAVCVFLCIWDGYARIEPDGTITPLDAEVGVMPERAEA